MSRHRTLGWVAWWAMVLAIVTGLVAGAVLQVGISLDSSVSLAFLAYGAVGAVISARRPGVALGWMFLLVALLTAMAPVAQAITDRAVADAGLLQPGSSATPVVVSMPLTPQLLLATAYLSAFWMVVISLSTTITVLLFPTAPHTRGWRMVLGAAVTAVAAMVVMTVSAQHVALNPDRTLLLVNPLSVGLPGSVWGIGSALFGVAAGVVLVCGVARVLAMLRDYRRSTGAERQQVRWFAWAAAIFLPLNVVALTVGDPYPYVQAVLNLVIWALIPVSCGIAILRYRLFDIDRVISRTTSYTIVTALVLATYAVTVASVSRVLGETSPVAVAGATLAAAALARPLLTRVQGVVDRRFNRERVDGQRAVEAFGARLANEVHPDRAVADLVEVTRRTLAPSTVSLWTVQR